MKRILLIGAVVLLTGPVFGQAANKPAPRTLPIERRIDQLGRERAARDKAYKAVLDARLKELKKKLNALDPGARRKHGRR